LLLLFLCMGQSYAQKNYYFSSSTGNDLNVGSEASPFQTISKLNSLVLVAGDKILFKKGDTFIGQIIVSYSGTNGFPIVYDSYGVGELPLLTASNGNNGVPDPLSTIRILGKQYLEFHNLRIENERFDAAAGSPNDQSFGIYYQSFKTLPSSGNFEDAVLFKHFRFSNLVVQNIYSLGSSTTDFDSIYSSGIYFLDAFVNDVIIEDCYFTDLERTGVWLRKYVSDAIIRNNEFIDTGGSGTILSATKRVLYEKNLMRLQGLIPIQEWLNEEVECGYLIQTMLSHNTIPRNMPEEVEIHQECMLIMETIIFYFNTIISKILPEVFVKL
jgi:hypothetical protein